MGGSGRGSALPGSQLERLRAAKLGALAESVGALPSGGAGAARAEDLVRSSLPGGAGLVSAGGEQAFALIDDGVVARFGAALAWASRAGARTLDVFVDAGAAAPASPAGRAGGSAEALGAAAGGAGGSAGALGAAAGGAGGSAGALGAAGVVARRAACFVRPDIRVWAVEGRSAIPAVPAPVVLEPAYGSPDPSQVSLLVDHGLEVVWEHGVLRGEVLGLEVVRTVGGALVVGVGRHDRTARLEMRPNEPLPEAIESAASAVRRLRRRGAGVHPANTLARSRWLRSVVVADPSLAGCSSLRPVAPPLPWFDLPEAGAAPCVGSTEEGRAAVVVCSVGVDLDVVPTAADAWLIYGRSGVGGDSRDGGDSRLGGDGRVGGDGGEAELIVVVPEGDDVAVTRLLAGALRRPAQVVTVPRDWDA